MTVEVQLSPEQVAYRAEVRELMETHVRPRAAEVDERAEFPHDLKDLFAEHGLFRLTAPPEYGGHDGLLLTFCLAAEEITRVCASSGMVVGNQSIGAGPIALYGSDEQKARFLPGLASGELLASFALTEPDAGSDVGGMRSTATPDGDGWRLNGQKVFITHANVADLLTVFAKAGGGDKRSITAFLLERDSAPWIVDRHELKMGLRGSTTCSVLLDDVRVPDSSRIGEVGQGMQVALGALNKGRILTSSMALGIAQAAFDVALEYTDPGAGAEPQSVGFPLAEMATELEAARTLVHKAAARYDAGDPDLIRLSAMTKLYATEMALRVTTRAVGLLGEDGLTSRYSAERHFRDARIFPIFEGTNEIQRIVIGRELRRPAAVAAGA